MGDLSPRDAALIEAIGQARYVRRNYQPVLKKSRYMAREIQQFFGGACGLIVEDLTAMLSDAGREALSATPAHDTPGSPRRETREGDGR